MRGIPQVAGAMVRVLVDGYEPSFQPEPAFSDAIMLFELSRPTVLVKGALRGRVLLEDGQLAPSARVAAGCVSAVADERGEFALDLTRAVTADAVTAIKSGFRPARMERPSEPRGDDTGWPEFIELRLGSASLSIAGRVVDEMDEPRAGVRVWIADPTLFGLIGTMPVQAENLMAGAAVPAEALAPDPEPDEQDGTHHSHHVRVGASSDAVWYFVVTDDDGRFRLEGLDDREYTVRVYDRKSLQQFTSKPIRAGVHDARIEMPPPDVFEKLSGRIVTVGDRPVPRASVALRANCHDVQARMFGGTRQVETLMSGTKVTTDEHGRFSFDRVPRERVHLSIAGDGILVTDWMIPPDVEPTSVEIFVDTRCRLEVRLAPPIDRADEIVIKDADGAVLQIAHTNSERTRTGPSVALEDGRSGVLSVTSSARTLELHKDGALVEKREIALVPDEILVVEL
jgi:hypothetical protein